jgi:hypothetical protein
MRAVNRHTCDLLAEAREQVDEANSRALWCFILALIGPWVTVGAMLCHLWYRGDL